MQGFSKHGFAKVRSGGIWNEKMIEYTKSSNLKYLDQRVDHPKWKEPQKFYGVYVFGNHLIVKNSSMDELQECIKTPRWLLLLLYSEDLFIDDVEEIFAALLKNSNTISVIDALKQTFS